MKPHVSIITLGVKDMSSAKQFYSEGLGWPIQQEHDQWICFGLGNGSSALGLYPWDALAYDAGVSADGGGFRGITLSYIVPSEERVDAVLTVAAGASKEVRGATDVANTFSGRARVAQVALVDGAVGAVWAHGGRPRVVFGFQIAGGKIVEIELLADPELLGELDVQILSD